MKIRTHYPFIPFITGPIHIFLGPLIDSRPWTAVKLPAKAKGLSCLEYLGPYGLEIAEIVPIMSNSSNSIINFLKLFLTCWYESFFAFMTCRLQMSTFLSYIQSSIFSTLQPVNGYICLSVNKACMEHTLLYALFIFPSFTEFSVKDTSSW